MFNLKDKYVAFHFFNERLSFPVVLFAKTKQESNLIHNYLTKDSINFFNVIDFINWSDAHGIDYQILFPYFRNVLKMIIFDTNRFRCYLSIKARIKKSTLFVTILP